MTSNASRDGVALQAGMMLYQKPVVGIDDRGEVFIRWAHPRSFVLPSLYPGDSLKLRSSDGTWRELIPEECYSTEEGAITAAITDLINAQRF